MIFEKEEIQKALKNAKLICKDEKLSKRFRKRGYKNITYTESYKLGKCYMSLRSNTVDEYGNSEWRIYLNCNNATHDKNFRILKRESRGRNLIECTDENTYRMVLNDLNNTLRKEKIESFLNG